MIRSSFVLFILLLSSISPAADLNAIFPPESKTSPDAAALVKNWFVKHCPDLTWTLSVTENPAKYQICSSGTQKVHINLALSHLTSEFVFWIEQDETGSFINWIEEEYPEWQLCFYSKEDTRKTKTCE